MELTPDPPGATPLELDELEALIPSWIATRADLNTAEHANLEAASRRVFGRRGLVSHVDDLLTVSFTNRLHQMMFGEVWRWAGSFRQRMTNIGVEPHLISVELQNALDDARHWHLLGEFEPVELSVRLHHRVVSVHPYPNGNGRHSRLMADAYLHQIGSPRLSWGAADLGQGEVRRRYIHALQQADHGDYAALITFAVS